MHKYLSDLNECYNDEQQKAVLLDSENNIIVKAPPGTGKTRILTLKAAKLLIENIETPRGIACITFTKKAAQELKNRLKLYGIKNSKNIAIDTINGFCIKNILYPYNLFYDKFDISKLDIVTGKNQLNEFCKSRKITEYKIKNGFEKFFKNYKYYTWEDPNKAADDYNQYLDLFLRDSQISFDLTIDIANELLENSYILKCIESKFPYILVDEYQDSSIAMHTLFKTLLEKTNIKFIVVGDPNQSIYSFTEANPEYFNEFYSSQIFQKFKFLKNYRCENNITEVANKFLTETCSDPSCANITCQYKYCPNGLEEQLNYIVNNILLSLEGNGIEKSKICILYRNKYTGDPIAEYLLNNNIKFVDQNKLYLNSENRDSDLVNWIEDTIFWLLKKNKNNESINFKNLFEYYCSVIYRNTRVSLERKNELKVSFYQKLLSIDLNNSNLKEFLDFILNHLEIKKHINNFRLIDQNALNELYSYANDTELNLNEFLNLVEAPDAVRLLSLHASKGLEFDAVIIPNFENGIFPDYRSKSEDELNEEKRLLFVAMTRAKKEFYILFSSFYTNQYGKFNNGYSPFFDNLKENFKCCEDFIMDI